MRYIDQWLSGLGLDHVIPLLQAQGITTPKKLALLTLRDIYEVVGVEDAEDRKKMYFLIQRLQTILKKEKPGESPSKSDNEKEPNNNISNSTPPRPGKSKVKSSPSPKMSIDTKESSPSSQVPRASFVDVSPLRPNKRKEYVSRKSQEEDDYGERRYVEEEHSHQSSYPGSPSSSTSSTEGKKMYPSSTTVRDDLKLLRRQARSTRDSISTPEKDNRNEHINNGNMRKVSPIVPPKSVTPSMKPTMKRGPVSMPNPSSPSRSKSSTPRLSTSPPPSPPPAPPASTSPPRIRTGLKQSSHTPLVTDKSNSTRTSGDNYNLMDMEESDMAIRVVVRKRPINRREEKKSDVDVLEIFPRGRVLVHEPKTKVDLTKVVETQEFIFDDSFDYYATNEEIYARVMRSLVATMFEGGKGSCFAYGQTGAGKTFTMMGSNPAAPAQARENAGLYVLAARDIFKLLEARKSKCKVVVSCFEIYGGKLFDLLNSRNPVKCLEDSKQRVQIPGLSEHVIESVQNLLDMMSKAHGQRSTGSTGANMESSRSHQVLQLQLVEERKQKSGKIISKPCGKLSFIDLAGSERGADTYNNSKQTRLEGAEINTSLLALKEVIRSLERKHGHTPFRGSKLTQVLKDSFIGEKTKTCMVACVSPSISNCEHTLNTLRYADRVKEHQQQRSDTEEKVRPSSAMPSDSASGDGRRLNLDTNMLIKNSSDVNSRPNTSAETRNKDELYLNVDDVGNNVSQANVRSSLLRAPKSSSRTSQNSRMSLQSPTTSNELSSRGEAKYGNRISASRISLNGPPPPPDSPDDEEETPVSTSITGGIRLRKGNAANGIKIHKGHNNSSGAPPPPPRSSNSGNLKDDKISSFSSPILQEQSNDNQTHAAVFEDRANEALLSLSALASGKSPYLNSDKEYESESDTSDEESIEFERARPIAESLSPRTRDRPQSDHGNSTQLLGKTVDLVSAHKVAIAEMVEVMKQEMELVHTMESADERDSEAYANELENLLKAKKSSVDLLRAELLQFQKFRQASTRV